MCVRARSDHGMFLSQNELRKVFFCKYNDPIYVKMEKLETIIRLVNDRNIDQVCFVTKSTWAGSRSGVRVLDASLRR